MRKTAGNTTARTDSHWAVEHDRDKCALCVVCARNCPTGALRRDESDGQLTLYYNAELCDACGGDPACQRRCPEEAIKIGEAGAGVPQPGEEQLLNQSAMVRCEYCTETFAPIRRLDVVAGRRESKLVERALCPLCRRTNMVVQFIETHRTPGQKAVYRSATSIIRKAKFRLDLEKAKKESKKS